MNTYTIYRSYQNGRKRVVRRGVTLAVAQAHCSNPETSSRTATSSAARTRLKRRGPWFDFYTRD